jgi:hypothetical protein
MVGYRARRSEKAKRFRRWATELWKRSFRQEVKNLESALQESERRRIDAEYRVHWAEQDAMDAQRELLESRYGNLDFYEEDED